MIEVTTILFISFSVYTRERSIGLLSKHVCMCIRLSVCVFVLVWECLWVYAWTGRQPEAWGNLQPPGAPNFTVCLMWFLFSSSSFCFWHNWHIFLRNIIFTVSIFGFNIYLKYLLFKEMGYFQLIVAHCWVVLFKNLLYIWGPSQISLFLCSIDLHNCPDLFF